MDFYPKKRSKKKRKRPAMEGSGGDWSIDLDGYRFMNFQERSPTPELFRNYKEETREDTALEPMGLSSNRRDSYESLWSGPRDEERRGRRSRSRTPDRRERMKLAVVPADFPSRKLTDREAVFIQNFLVREMFSIRERGGAPKFEDTYYDSGAVFMTAADEQAASWLGDKIRMTELNNGLKLRVALVKKLFAPTAISVRIVEPLHREDPNFILHLLRVQNEGLRTEDWCVLKRSQEPTAQTFLLNVDMLSMDALLKNNLRAYLGLTQITFRLLSDDRRRD